MATREDDPMSLIDAEVSRLKSEVRVLTRERNSAAERMRIAEDKAEDFRQMAENDAEEFNRRQSVWLKKLASAKRLADHFISKTTNLVMMRCDFCEHEWVRDGKQEHDDDCPVGVVLARPPTSAEAGEHER